MIRRTDNTILARWWWTVDWTLLTPILILAGIGIVMSFAAGPTSAERLGYSTFFFPIRHAIFMSLALAAMLAVSMLSVKWVRRVATVIFIMAFIGLILTFFIGHEVKGAARWIKIASFTLQPSEFIKPTLMVFTGWLLAEQTIRPKIPAFWIAIIIFCLVIAMLIAQPDLGQSVLITASWGAMVFVAGLRLRWVIMSMAGFAGAGLILYSLFPHARQRIDVFLDKESGDSFQVDVAMKSIANGDWFGVGIGEGEVKSILPDAHTDFIFSVMIEEFGLIFAIFVVMLYAWIVGRALYHAIRSQGLYIRNAITGLAMLFGIQAFINIGVNMQLLPAKGMTLPFISYGGSSLIAIGLTLGFLLALTRHKPALTINEIEDEFVGS